MKELAAMCRNIFLEKGSEKITRKDLLVKLLEHATQSLKQLKHETLRDTDPTLCFRDTDPDLSNVTMREGYLLKRGREGRDKKLDKDALKKLDDLRTRCLGDAGQKGTAMLYLFDEDSKSWSPHTHGNPLPPFHTVRAAYVYGRGARVVLQRPPIQSGTVVGCSDCHYLVRLDNSADQVVTVPGVHAVLDTIPDEIPRYPKGERLLLFVGQGDSKQQAQWVDGTVVAHLGLGEGSRHSVHVAGATHPVEIDLHRLNHTKQNLSSAKEFAEERERYRRYLRVTRCKAIDAITGKALDIVDQTVNVSVLGVGEHWNNMVGLAEKLAIAPAGRLEGKHAPFFGLVCADAGTGKVCIYYTRITHEPHWRALHADLGYAAAGARFGHPRRLFAAGRERSRPVQVPEYQRHRAHRPYQRRPTVGAVHPPQIPGEVEAPANAAPVPQQPQHVLHL